MCFFVSYTFPKLLGTIYNKLLVARLFSTARQELNEFSETQTAKVISSMANEGYSAALLLGNLIL